MVYLVDTNVLLRLADRGHSLHPIIRQMLAHEITHILTFNGADFSRYTPVGIVAVDPATV